MLDQLRSDTAFLLDNWRQILSLNNVLVFLINVACIIGGVYGFMALSSGWQWAALAVAAAGGVGIAEAIAGRLMEAQ